MSLTSGWLAASLLCTFAFSAQAQGGLQVSFGGNGLERISYNGTVLEDVSQFRGDAFHVGHMKVTDLSGNLLSGPQYDWGEVNNGKSWNPLTHAWTYSFRWGSLTVQFVPNGGALDMHVTAQNFAGSGVIFDGVVIYPLALHFPQLPVGFGDSSFEHLAFNTTGPSVTLADFGTGEVASVLTDAHKPLYTGFEPAGSPFTYYPVISGTALDNMATFFPRNDRPVKPGETDSFTVSLRFALPGTTSGNLAADAYRSWAQTWPSQVNWTDRRIIGTAYLASSGEGPSSLAAGFPNNPRRYFNDGNAANLDVRGEAGLKQFQSRILQQAADNVGNLQRLNAQGIITWDIEGQQFPHTTSYVCSPDQIAQVAPEMESIIGDPSSPYNGMKLDDAYFKIMRDAGFRVGVCIRPQHFAFYGNGTAEQLFLPPNQIAAELTGKIKYAHDRWGATLFYVDSTVDERGGVLDPAIFQQVSASVPDSLLIPEESSPKYYAYTAPFQTFIFHSDLGTSADVYNYYPKAFSVNLVNDVDPGRLMQYRFQLTASVRRGDILMMHADYWQENNSTIVQMYQDAGVGGIPPLAAPIPSAPVPVGPEPVEPAPLPQPAPVTPPVPATVPARPVAITNVVSGAVLSGSVVVNAAIKGTLDAAGSYLMVDGVEVGTYRNTNGPYSYPLDTTRFNGGTHVLQVWAHNINNETLTSAPVNVTFGNLR